MILVLVAFVLAAVSAEITIIGTPQTIYDRSPKLRIRGAGFDAEDHDITLELAAQGEASLRVDKDYLITKDPQGEGLILKLLNQRRWVNLDKRTPPVALVLSAVYFRANPALNLLKEERIIANVLETPEVKADDRVMYQGASAALTISGSGFMGSKEVEFYFDPPVLQEIAYEVVTPFPLQKDSIELRLRHGFQWRDEPGELRLVGVDTGGGPVKLNDDKGILVANVRSDLESHNVVVEDTADDQKVYWDHPEVVIQGRGFNPDGCTLRFSNGIMGEGVNYTTMSITETSIRLRLASGSHWRRNADNLPGFLTLMAVNNGGPDGWVPTGPMNSGKGKDIASIYEKPSVHSSVERIYRTHSHELHIDGKGFTKGIMSKTKFKFSPPLKEGVDYVMRQIDREDMEVTLLDDRAWRETPGPLLIVAVNTMGEEGGWMNTPGDGVHVADIVADIDAAKTGGIEIFPQGQKVYQSVLQRDVTIFGQGFKTGIKLHLDPPLLENVDYTLEIESSNKMSLNLVSGHKWAREASFLIVKAVTIAGDKHNMAGEDGIRVAVVLSDPVVSPGTSNFHETQSKVISISGTGFTNVADTKLTIRPTTGGSYKVLGVSEDTVRVQLKPDYDWLPSFLSLTDESDDKKIPLQVTAVDSGAGEVEFDFPVTIGYVVKDREGVICDDSCDFSFDGICDDGTETEYYYEYEAYGYYMDDDLGGYYYVGDDAYSEDMDDDDFDDVTYDDEEDDTEYDDYDDKGDDGYDDYDDEAEYDDDEYYMDDDYYMEGHREGYYAYAYDDYYAPDDEYTVSACLEGTDCTDCGGVDAIVDFSKAPAAGSGVESCTNTCPYARDGICDDPRGANYCQLGTDCQDCGPLGADNFTRIDDDGWWDDDDDYWTFNDGTFLDQAKGLEANRHRVQVSQVDSAGPAAMFLIVLEGMVYAVGGVFAAIALYLAMRVYNGHSMPFMQAFNPDESAMRDLELQPTRKMAITPDVIRT